MMLFGGLGAWTWSKWVTDTVNKCFWSQIYEKKNKETLEETLPPSRAELAQMPEAQSNIWPIKSHTNKHVLHSSLFRVNEALRSCSVGVMSCLHQITDFVLETEQTAAPPASGTHSFHHRTPSPCSNPLGQINTFIETIISDCALTLKKSVFVSCWMEFLTFVLFLENRGQKKKNAFLFSFLSPSLHGGTTQCCHVLTTVTFLWNSCVGWRLVGSSSVEINPRLRK